MFKPLNLCASVAF
uniref:Uncharacterized protein n=1 Tax=Rhizophora mucronata TaxID=61149 RepID=A0A2P2NSZ2_RHIMU